MIRNSTGVPVELEKGRHGQLDFVVNGRTVLSRKGGLIAKLVGRPWPEPEDVLEAVRETLRGEDGSDVL